MKTKIKPGPGEIGSVRIGFISDFEKSELRKLIKQGKIAIYDNEVWAWQSCLFA